MFGSLTRLLKRAAIRPPEFHLPDLHLRDLSWEDLADFAQGPGRRSREHRGGVLLPTMLTVAGAGATLWWWRQWAQGHAESSAAEGAVSNPIVAASAQPALEASLAVQGAEDPSEPLEPGA